MFEVLVIPVHLFLIFQLLLLYENLVNTQCIATPVYVLLICNKQWLLNTCKYKRISVIK